MELFEDINLPEGFDRELVLRAYKFAKKAHKGQKRRSGDDYITHPVAVARILLELDMSADMVAAALLHDVAEDTKYGLSEIETEFGAEIRFLVDAVSNLRKVDFSAYSNTEEAEEAKSHSKNESLRDLFLAMAEDARVVVIKLADRLHNMRTLKALPRKDQQRIARETLNIFAPLALRLGIGEIRGQLEDLAFPIAYPSEYKLVRKEANIRYKAADRYALMVKRSLADAIAAEGIAAEVDGRAKHIYSLYKKLTRPDINWDFDKIYDLVALRIITESEGDCYKILGLVHSIFRPLPGHVKDYIAAPKPNGYRSIHTTVFGPEGKIFEIQVRTHEMHEEAEYGVASHMHYTLEKSKGKSSKELDEGKIFADQKQTEFLKRIKDWQGSVSSTDDFLEGLKLEFLDDRIYVFSPNGDIFDLPVGSTAVDFAYEVHSKVGDSCVGAKINGRMSSLDVRLETRDVVEIITGKKDSPRRDWLEFVKTSKARQHIRSFLRAQDHDKNIEAGRLIVEKEFDLLGLNIDSLRPAEIRKALSETTYKSLEDLYVAVGAGQITRRQAIKTLLRRPLIQDAAKKPSKSLREPQKDNFKGMKINIAPCCNPTRSDTVICYVTRGRGLTVHKRSCTNIASLEPERLYHYNPWLSSGFSIELEVLAENRVGLIRDVTNVISRYGANIDHIENTHLLDGAKSKIMLTLFVADIAEAADIIRALGEVETVTGVTRVITTR